MLLIILAWLYYFLISYLLGTGIIMLLRRYLRSETPSNDYVFYSFWLGYVFVVGLLQIFSIWLPIGTTVFVIISLAAVLAGSFSYHLLRDRVIALSMLLRTGSGVVGLAGVVALLLLVSYSANREVEHADTFIYHFNAVKWAKEYPAVPGLANLHGRLGFNSSFFLFAAMTDIGVFTNQSAHIALSFMMVVCLIHWGIIIFRKHEFAAGKIFCMLTAPYLLTHVLWKVDINSLSTDYPTAVLLLVFCLLLLDQFPHKVILLLPLSALIVAFKLSGIIVVFVAVIILAAFGSKLVFERRNRLINRRIVTVSFLAFILILIPFLVRNAIISGWLIYPFQYGSLNLPWSVPKEYVVDMVLWIKSYPKIPGGVSPQTLEGEGFLFWFVPWYTQFKESTELVLLCVSLLLILFVTIQHASRRFFYPRLNHLAVLGLALGCIAFWFFSAPDIRFGSIFFYILFAISFVLFCDAISNSGSVILVYLIFIFLVAKQARSFIIDREPKLFSFTYTEPVKLRKVIASPPGEKPPLFVFMPQEGDACGNSPLPCTPYAGGKLHENRGVRQRQPGDISKGFLPLL